MASTGHEADVIVIGGGPAGSTAAALLAGAGRRVILFEKERFPRFHIGESLLPFNMDLFRRLGVADRLGGRFVEKYGARLMSSDGSIGTYVNFAEGLVPGYPMSYQVLRSSFDDMLLRNAAERGAIVHEATAVLDASASHREGCEVTVRAADGSEIRHRARFLLDASGRDAFVASRRRLRRMMPRLRKAAVFAHYEGVARDEGRRGGDIILVVLKNGWFWFIPLQDGVTSVGLVMEGSIMKEGGLTPEDLLDRSLARCPAARDLMRGARRVSPVHAASDYSYACDSVAGDGYLLLGDAAGFIDPVFSSGVWLAMSSAEMAADDLHRALGGQGRAPDLSPRAFRGYERRVSRHLRAYIRIVSRFYQPGFMDVFLQPTSRFGLKESVVSLLAGQADPGLSHQARLWCFYAVLSLQRRIRLVPRVPLLSVLEEAPA